MKNKKEFIEFLSGSEAPPPCLKRTTQVDMVLCLKKNSILVKFVAYQLLGALISLTFCPQFGLGLIEGHGITHIFRLIGDWACAAFCGSLFLSSGMLLAYIGMKSEELWWIWRRFKFSLILLPAFLWGGLMLTNLSLNLPKETPLYHATWIAVAILIETLWFHFKSVTFTRVLQSQGSRG